MLLGKKKNYQQVFLLFAFPSPALSESWPRVGLVSTLEAGVVTAHLIESPNLLSGLLNVRANVREVIFITVSSDDLCF